MDDRSHEECPQIITASDQECTEDESEELPGKELDACLLCHRVSRSCATDASVHRVSWRSVGVGG